MSGRLHLSAKKQIDLCKIFNYPLLSETVCFAYPDRTFQDSPISKVKSFLKEYVNSHPPSDVNTVVVDIFFDMSNKVYYVPNI